VRATAIKHGAGARIWQFARKRTASQQRFERPLEHRVVLAGPKPADPGCDAAIAVASGPWNGNVSQGRGSACHWLRAVFRAHDEPNWADSVPDDVPANWKIEQSLIKAAGGPVNRLLVKSAGGHARHSMQLLAVGGPSDVAAQRQRRTKGWRGNGPCARQECFRLSGTRVSPSAC
jgi:hypothetical protein